MNIKNTMTVVKKAVVKRSPELLVGAGLICFAASAILAAKAAPKASKKLQELHNQKGGKPTVPETVKTVAKDYAPAVGAFAAGTVCVLSAHNIQTKRISSFAVAYEAAALSLSTYKEKVVETVSKETLATINDKVAKAKIEKNPPKEGAEPIIIGSNEVLCYDPMIDRYFPCNMEKIRAAVNTINATLISQDYISLNEFYDELGLKHVKNGDDLGWNIGTDGLVDIRFDSIVSDDGKPALVLEYRIEPRFDFRKLM